MITVYFFVIFMAGTGKAVEQIGPFETMQQCNAARRIVDLKAPTFTHLTECFQGVAK